MRRVSIALALFALLLVLPGLASARGSLLYSVASGDLVVGGVAGAPRVSVPAKAQLHWFTDRPDRRSGVGTAADLVAGWTANRFDRVPPNAAIVTTRAGSTMQTIVTLRDPVLRRGRVSFAYSIVDDGKMLGMRTSGRPLMGRYRGELFVDSAAIPPCATMIMAASTAGTTVCIAAPGTSYKVIHPPSPAGGSGVYAAVKPSVRLCTLGSSDVTVTVGRKRYLTGQTDMYSQTDATAPPCAAYLPNEVGVASAETKCFFQESGWPLRCSYQSYDVTISAARQADGTPADTSMQLSIVVS